MSDLRSDGNRNSYMLCDASGRLTPFTEFGTRAFLPFCQPHSWAPSVIPRVFLARIAEAIVEAVSRMLQLLAYKSCSLACLGRAIHKLARACIAQRVDEQLGGQITCKP
jgi:hypothetical protein